MESGRQTVSEEKRSVVHTTRVEYYHNDVKLTFPLEAPITTRVKHVYYVGGWKSCKWGPPPNMDGTPSSEGLDSTVILPSTASTSTTRVADSSTSSTTAKSAGTSFSTFSAPATTKPVDAVTNAKKVPASQGQPANSVRSIKKASNMPVLSHTAATLPTSSVQPATTTGKPLNKSRNMGGGFLMVSATESDDEFDVVDSKGPSAANGATKGSHAVANGLDSAFHAGWEDDE